MFLFANLFTKCGLANSGLLAQIYKSQKLHPPSSHKDGSDFTLPAEPEMNKLYCDRKRTNSSCLS